MAKLMWSAMEAEGTLYSKCINGKEPLWEGGSDGGRGRRAGQSTKAHHWPNCRSKLHENTQHSPQWSTKATVTEEQKKEYFRFWVNTRAGAAGKVNKAEKLLAGTNASLETVNMRRGKVKLHYCVMLRTHLEGKVYQNIKRQSGLGEHAIAAQH